MDSGDSGSMQSSSGRDDHEFDSRAESVSSFLNPSPHNFGSISAPNPTFLPRQNPTLFSPHLPHNLNDNDPVWPGGLRSEPTFAYFGNLTTPPSSSLPSRTQSNTTASTVTGGPFPGPSSSVQPHTDAEGHPSRAPSQSNVLKNPKKRNRASRRAPTTVMTTDVNNFRQMVQEFTGIPASPFSGTSPYSRKLDLLSAASTLRGGAHLDALRPLYPQRPSAHGVVSPFPSSSSAGHPQPSLLNSNMIDAMASTTNVGNTNDDNNTASMAATKTFLGASTSNNQSNFPLSSDHLLNPQRQGIIPLQPTLQLGGNAQVKFGELSGILSRENASAAAVRVRDNDDILRRWKSGETVRNNDGVEDSLVGFDGNINSRGSQHLSGYNLNLADKGMENMGSSGAEGTVSPWICPSD